MFENVISIGEISIGTANFNGSVICVISLIISIGVFYYVYKKE